MTKADQKIRKGSSSRKEKQLKQGERDAIAGKPPAMDELAYIQGFEKGLGSGVAKITKEDVEKIIDLAMEKRLLYHCVSADEVAFWTNDLVGFIEMIVNGLYLDRRLHNKYGWRIY